MESHLPSRRACLALLGGAGVARPCSFAVPRRLWAKAPGSQSRLFAFERNGRVGFIDPTGEIVIPPRIPGPIEQVGDFCDGLATVSNRGYIDERGESAIQGDFLIIRPFSEGIAWAWAYPKDHSRQEGRLLDRAGRVLAVLPDGTYAGDFTGGLAVFRAKGKPAIRKFTQPFVYRDFPGLKGYIDRTGRVAIEPQFADVGPFVGDLARAVLDGVCYIDAPGSAQATPTTGSPNSCGGAPEEATSPCAVGFIDRTGRFAIEPRFQSARDFQDGLAAVRIEHRWGYCDTRGRLVIGNRFDRAQSFREGLASVVVDGQHGYIDRAGRVAIALSFDGAEPFSDSLAVVQRYQRFFYIDRQGHTRIRGPFMEATSFVQGLAAVREDNRNVRYIDPSGKTVFEYQRRA